MGHPVMTIAWSTGSRWCLFGVCLELFVGGCKGQPGEVGRSEGVLKQSATVRLIKPQHQTALRSLHGQMKSVEQSGRGQLHLGQFSVWQASTEAVLVSR